MIILNKLWLLDATRRINSMITIFFSTSRIKKQRTRYNSTLDLSNLNKKKKSFFSNSHRPQVENSISVGCASGCYRFHVFMEKHDNEHVWILTDRLSTFGLFNCWSRFICALVTAANALKMMHVQRCRFYQLVGKRCFYVFHFIMSKWNIQNQIRRWSCWYMAKTNTK